jgi:hypothetical protein
MTNIEQELKDALFSYHESRTCGANHFEAEVWFLEKILPQIKELQSQLEAVQEENIKLRQGWIDKGTTVKQTITTTRKSPKGGA